MFVNYSNYNLIKQLGIDLFIGKNSYTSTIKLMDKNYNTKIECNFKNYILQANLDPLKIINSDENIIIIDTKNICCDISRIFYLY